MNAGLSKKNGYSIFYRLLTFLGGYFLTAGFAVPASMAVLPGVSAALIFLAVLLCCLTGYLFQSLYCLARRIKRADSGLSYESDVKYYNFARALPVLLTAGTAAYFLIYKLSESYLIAANNIPGSFYDPDSIVPFVLAATGVASVFMGSFTWFFPYDRMLTGRAAVVGLIVSAVSTVLFFVFSSSAQAVSGICFIGYATVVQFAMNQANINRSYKGAVGATIGNRARGYNLTLTMMVFAVFTATSAVFYVLTAGLSVLLRLLFALLLSSTHDPNDTTESIESEDRVSALGDYIFRKNGKHDESGKIYLIIFIVVVALLLFYIITRRKSFMKTLVFRLQTFIVGLFLAIFGPISDFFKPDGGEEYTLYYVDEEERHQPDVISAKKRAEKRSSKKSWQDMVGVLKTKHTAEEKYRYAYSQLVDTLRANGKQIKDSDTPREIAEKLKGESIAVDAKTADRLTEEFERIEFAGGTGASQEAFDSVCDIIINNL